MPCIQFKTNKKLTDEQKQQLPILLSAKTAELVGKPEMYVMAIVEDNLPMSMSATADPTAYIEFKSINLPEDETKRISASLCQLIHEQLSIDSKRTYIEFSNAQRHLWGWNEGTF